MKGVEMTVEESIEWIDRYADDARLLARQMLAWQLDGLRVVAGDAVVVPIETDHVRLFLCHCPAYREGHFHAVIDRTDPRMCQRCLHLKALHLHETDQCVPGAPCPCEGFVPPPPTDTGAGLNPDHPAWEARPSSYPGCRLHGADPCGVCDVE